MSWDEVRTRLRQELGKRSGKEAMGGLAIAVSSYDTDVQKLARETLDLVLGRLSPTALASQWKKPSSWLPPPGPPPGPPAPGTGVFGPTFPLCLRITDWSARVRSSRSVP